MFYLILVSLIITLEYIFSWSLKSLPDGGNSYLWDNLLSNNVFIIDIVQFVSTHLVIQLAIFLYALIIGNKIVQYFQLRINKWLIISLIYIVVKLFIYYRNTLLFPKSSFQIPVPAFLQTELALSLISTVFIAALVIFPLIITGIYIYKNVSTRVTYKILGGVAISFSVLALTQIDISSTAESSSKSKNIIILGIDSVSWQHIDENITLLPTIAKLASSGYVWNNSITPLARTFPAWNSVLTGKYPAQHNAIFNLSPQASVSRDNIANFLKNRGYFTVYAQDERRFNNIDESYGFDITIGPQVGVADFILPTFADHPVSNVFYDTPLGNTLFPYIALNRVSSITYTPARFVKSISNALDNNTKPLFLAAHLCLTHIPYTWSHSTPAMEGHISHKQALIAIDKQLQELLAELKDKNLLNNTTLVLFSDHGEQTSASLQQADNKSNETFFASADNFRGKKAEHHTKTVDTIFSLLPGHGTNLNSRAQYNSFMIFNDFGSNKPRNKINSSSVSLTSLAPTALHLANIKTNRFGKSLMSSIYEPEASVESLPVFLETGLQVKSIQDTNHIDHNKLLREAAHYYHITESGLVEIKPTYLNSLSSNKQKAVIWSEWMLIRKQELLILIDTKSGEWTYDFDSNLATRAPLEELYKLLTSTSNKQTSLITLQ